MLKKIRDVFILFLLFSFAGWIYEVILGFIHYGVFLNRGYNFGPWLPIYGFGGLILYAIFGRLINKPVYIGKVNIRIFTIVIYIAVFATIIELASTYIMEFNGLDFKKLWDYSKYAFNFESRIAPEPSIKFGLLGALVFYLVMPLYNKFINMKNQKLCNIISCTIIVLFLIDFFSRFILGSNYTGPA